MFVPRLVAFDLDDTLAPSKSAIDPRMGELLAALAARVDVAIISGGQLAQLELEPGPLVDADFTGASGARATHELLDLSRPPTAIIYANDLMAIAGMSVAADRGIRVPHDLSIVGFDDIPLAPYVVPPLTTVRQDVFEWGRVCAQTLVAIVEGRTPEPVKLPPVEFIVRGSTGQVHHRSA
jgi:DNA-binding LacI/PurR family transcriptional regulator